MADDDLRRLDAEIAAEKGESAQRYDGCPPPLPDAAYVENNRSPERPRVAELRSRIRRASEIEPVLSARYLVKNWLDQGGFSVWFGESNAGKTFLSIDLGFHVGAGWDWYFSRAAGGGGSVVYIAAEGGGGVKNRVAAVGIAHPELVEASNFFLLTSRLDLCQPQDAEALIAALADLPTPPVLIAIDTLARSMGDGDENSAQDMGRFIKSIDRIREVTGAHVMVIHHSGKDTSKGARGSSSLRAAADTEVEITRNGDVITARPTKQRDMPLGAAFNYRLKDVELGVDEDGDPVTSAVVEAVEAPARVAPAAPRLSPNQFKALEALRQYLGDHGTPCPGGTGWPEPGSRKIVPVADFLRFLAAKMTSAKPDSRRRMAQRALDDLVAKGLAQLNEGAAWII